VIPPARDTLLETVRGDRGRRPRRDDQQAAGLRATIEDHVFTLLGATRPDAPLVVSSASLRATSPRHDVADATLARARGVLVAVVVRLLVAHVHVDDPFDDALAVWRAQRPADALLASVEHLEADQVARLRSDVGAHASLIATEIGPLATSWVPRTSQRSRLILAGGAVHVNDVVDLVLGSTRTERASVALVDVTTSPLAEGAERVMRFHALVQTLRTSVVPLRTSIFSSATGELWSRDVDAELLHRAVEDLNAALSRLVAP
jgi:hypothetical protein